ncbi:MAG: sigma 54-interacting transcriptional regulator [Syntrophomonas sp.]|uniref:sigma-54 interaction domain-containing protein n=1 Tax=Syntrophomonas sp. TaxID=2053627 RepID=UPI00262C1DD8|nr:sigma 54-interacting transcriptional regulator [Syntrophomonas sp.]MDD2510675.1 sigma 54-interacting transcriptional regulator [Syntrophomonas sp.]MDD3878709.1 sigma 54-interacting transcriptional regulator [Syntrophomonas sp.]MDD4626155.1 sigma 54-interacting transcriptional regulator [Syntrophomonas sp.]
MPDLTVNEITSILEGLIENPYMFYVIVDSDGIISSINQTYLDILEIKKEDVVGQHILDITPNSGLPEVLRTGRMDKADIWSIKGRDTIVTRVPIFKNGKIIGAIASSLFLDMSGAKILMKKLQETEKEFTAILEGLIESPHMAYVIVDKEGFITVMNQTFLDILEMKKEEVIGKYVLEILPHSKMIEILKSGRVDKADIWPIRGRDTIVTRTPIKKHGEIIGAIGHSLFLDMSGAKILAKKLQETEKELSIYRNEVSQIYSARWNFDDLVGCSQEFLAVKSMAQQLSHSISTILITGESGTGKELFAQAIHNGSERKNWPFVRINCAALPENLLESELFGYEEGAFTGARKGGKPGKFELAKGGTIFLDEIGDMPLTMQNKLLTVLQEKIVERVGGTTPLAINVRVIAATNRDLEKMVENQEFREDLYYRLNVVGLSIPPLRRRMDDIPLLVNDLIHRINQCLKTDISGIEPEAIDLLREYSWPGNVRELENLLERAINLAVMRNEQMIGVRHFPSLDQNNKDKKYAKIEILDDGQSSLPQLIEKIEKQMIIQYLQESGGNRQQTAKMLGIHSSALYRKLNKYGLE